MFSVLGCWCQSYLLQDWQGRAAALVKIRVTHRRLAGQVRSRMSTQIDIACTSYECPRKASAVLVREIAGD